MTTEKKPRRGPRATDKDPARTGRIIRQLRLNKDITQEELATAIGYKNHNSISHIETGFRVIPAGKLLAAARYLGVDAEKIRKPIVRVAK
jgi:transcriptional regulator with XRE-family HTH domain